MSKKSQNSLSAFLARDNENSTKPEGSQNTSGHQSKRLSDAYFEHSFDEIKEILKITVLSQFQMLRSKGDFHQ